MIGFYEKNTHIYMDIVDNWLQLIKFGAPS